MQDVLMNAQMKENAAAEIVGLLDDHVLLQILDYEVPGTITESDENCMTSQRLSFGPTDENQTPVDNYCQSTTPSAWWRKVLTWGTGKLVPANENQAEVQQPADDKFGLSHDPTGLHTAGIHREEEVPEASSNRDRLRKLLRASPSSFHSDRAPVSAHDVDSHREARLPEHGDGDTEAETSNPSRRMSALSFNTPEPQRSNSPERVFECARANPEVSAPRRSSVEESPATPLLELHPQSHAAPTAQVCPDEAAGAILVRTRDGIAPERLLEVVSNLVENIDSDASDEDLPQRGAEPSKRGRGQEINLESSQQKTRKRDVPQGWEKFVLSDEEDEDGIAEHRHMQERDGDQKDVRKRSKDTPRAATSMRRTPETPVRDVSAKRLAKKSKKNTSPLLIRSTTRSADTASRPATRNTRRKP